ncbi:hypothetical protein LTR10_002970 [Elasticomyces elasticus]|nr:hypothetical protein LTR10_002970 [Elasticomyces elasticus]KAK4967692.1 hypothetical protein LTR42_010017 [Elasticomyces elasticus]
MAHTGALTRGNILYEGNYTEWAERIGAMFEVNNIQASVDRDGALTVSLGLDYFSRGSRDVALLIKPQVSTSVFARVPTAFQGYANPLLRSLHAHARPFRLNDLPPELRTAIYKLHFGQSVCQINPRTMKDATVQSRSNLLLVSRATRLEALPIFFSGLELCFIGKRYGARYTVEQAINNWVQDSVKENVKYLRRLQVQLSRPRGPYCITINLDMQKGLQVECSANVAKEKKVEWDKHVMKMEPTRKALKMQGEAIILAATTKGAIWDTASP